MMGTKMARMELFIGLDHTKYGSKKEEKATEERSLICIFCIRLIS